MPSGDRAADAGTQHRGSAIFRLLADVPDPEIPVISVVDLGIVREFREGNPGTLVITPTYSGCPASAVIHRSITEALDRAGFTDIIIQSQLAPPWTTDWISARGREALRAYGIAPPSTAAEHRGERGPAVPCPRCASPSTVEISRFGSTLCKALWRCLDCAEPFDRFKCL